MQEYRRRRHPVPPRHVAAGHRRISPALSITCRTDIAEHHTREGKLYCAVVLDAYCRRVVGWSIDASPTAALVMLRFKRLGLRYDRTQRTVRPLLTCVLINLRRSSA